MVLRDAPGADFFSGLYLPNTTCNETVLSLNIFQETNTTCNAPNVYNFAEHFPECACSLVECDFGLLFCENGTGSLPTEECILGDSTPHSPSVLKEVCGDGFLRLLNKSACTSGLHNNFQVCTCTCTRTLTHAAHIHYVIMGLLWAHSMTRELHNIMYIIITL